MREPAWAHRLQDPAAPAVAPGAWHGRQPTRAETMNSVWIVDDDQSIRAYDYFVDAFRHGDIARERIEEALGRVSGIKFKLDSVMLP